MQSMEVILSAFTQGVMKEQSDFKTPLYPYKVGWRANLYGALNSRRKELRFKSKPYPRIFLIKRLPVSKAFSSFHHPLLLGGREQDLSSLRFGDDITKGWTELVSMDIYF